MKKISINDCQALANKNNGSCLSVEYKNNKTKMEWQCNKGHQSWWAIYNSINRGSWCPHCSKDLEKKTIDDCQELARSKNGKCLATEYTNVKTKIKWQCHLGHIWLATYDAIKHRTWCPKCAQNARKNTISDCQKIAKLKNGKCLSTEYKNNDTSMKWQCSSGHIFQAKYTNVISGKWCPKCYNERRSKSIKLSIDYCNRVAKSKGGSCLSTKYNGVFSKVKWKCKYGHIWEASTNSINSGTWCPKCRINKTQRILLKIIETIFCKYEVLSEFNDFDWLYTNKGRKQAIDIFIPELKLAIEYDGEQHFIPIRFGNYSANIAKQRLKRTIELDKMKDDKIKKHPLDVEYFIRFDYTEKDKLDKKYVLDRLIYNNIPVK